MSHHVHPNSKSLELPRLINAMTSIKHYYNLLILLGHLAGQLGGFVGESESVKKAVDNALDIFNKQLKECKNAKNPSHNLDCQDPSNCHDITQQIEKLKSQESAIKSNVNNPNELLKNLCDGLETFLGFNSDSKGYTGDGIVYSDLDRLCDGVMGFLYGVLSNIREHLGQHKDTLNDAINILNTNKHAGKNGFNDAIGKVVAGVRGYNEKVKRSNDDVKGKIEDLYNYVKTENGGKLRSEIQNMQDPENPLHFDSAVFNAENLVKQAVAKSTHFATELNKATKDINDFNLDCKTSVNHAHRNVKHETERLEQSADKELRELKAMEDVIKTTLEGVRQKIAANIRKDVTELVKKCKATLQSILRQLKKISGDLEKYVKQLVDWMDEAARFIDDAVQKIEKILQEMNENDAYKNAGKIKNAVTQMGTDIKTLHEAGKNVKEGIVEWVRTANETKVNQLDGWKTAAQKVISGAVSKAREVHGRLSEKNTNMSNTAIGQGIQEIEEAKRRVSHVDTEITKKVEDLQNWNKEAKRVVEKADAKCRDILMKVDDTYVTNRMNGTKIRQEAMHLEKEGKALLNAYKEAHGGLKDLVKGIRGQVDGLKAHIVDDLTKLKGDVESAVGTHVTGIIDAVLSAAGKAKYDSSGPYPGAEGLQGDVKLGNNLRELVQNIGNDSIIKTRIELLLEYLKNKLNAKFSYAELSKEPDKKEIIDKIKKDFSDAATSKPFKDLDTVKNSDEDHKKFMEIMQNYHRHAINPATNLNRAIDAVNTAMNNFDELDVFKVQGAINKGEIKAAEKAFRAHVNSIETQLKSITGLVNSDRGTKPIGTDQEGIKERLQDMSRALSDTLTSWNETTGGGHVPGLPAIHEQLQKLQHDTLKKQPEAMNQGVQKIRGELTKLQNELHNTGSKDVINSLEDLQNRGLERNAWEGQSSTNGLLQIKQDITTALDQIRDDVTGNLGIIDGFTAGALSQFNDVISNLTKLCEDVKHEGDGAKSLLTALKNENIRKNLEYIKTQIENLKDLDLKTVIQEAEKFLSSIDLSCESTIQLLGNSVMEHICAAEKTLKTHARKQYVDAIKFLLEQFADKVAAELKPLPEKIAKDLEIGHKGFMKKLHDKFITDPKGIIGIKDIDSTSSPKGTLPLSYASAKVHMSLRVFVRHLKDQPDFKPDVSKISAVNDAITKLLEGLKASQHFDDTFSTNLDALNNAVTSFKPSTYGAAKCPLLLNALKAGFTPLVEELKKAYVSSYSGRQLQEEELGRYAKICWTITPILYQELTALKDHLDIDGWTAHRIYDAHTPTSSLHALFFRDNGYDVHRPENAEHGELNHKRDFNGSSILKHLTNEAHNLFSQRSSPVTDIPRSASGSDELGVTVAEESGLIRKLYDCLKTYFKVCHLTLVDKPRAPCSVYEILVWCCGLQFNPVYEKLKAHIESEFMKEDKQRPGTKTLQPFEAHPSPFQHTHIDEALYKVSSDSHAVLTAILGHGHKDGIYACEFSNNSMKLDYPSNLIQLLCTLFDLLKRLYHQLYFLLQQCRHNAQLSGWRECHYGRYIGGSGWQCNTKQCPKQDCDQRHDQSGSQTSGQYPNCGVKSPLQSFLEDGLKGHLPHSVAARGSSLSCGTCGNTAGMPCRTPMGFADIGAIASHTMIGRNICEVLYYFCGRHNSPLTRLCGYLNCLLPSAPKTLADMFSFYHHLTDRWGMHGNEHKKEAFEEKVNAANFGRSYGEFKVYHLFTPSHSALKKGHSDGSLGSLVCLSRDSVVCGPYLRPISHAIYETFSSEHADKYLSWIVYLTASFYDLLKKLYDECNSKCGSRGSNCHVKACIKECRTTSTTYQPPRYHDRNCKSIVSCNNTLPTLAKYGFVFGDPERLNGSAGIEKKRTCRDFCTVFAEAFEKDSHLVKFFKAIDKFMFTIRAPFLWMNVALWSLSLFYLICVMVGRLDVLHIKSHLRSPSSHKITAQSLLAASQVGRLAKISYLQP
ncbi:hypothetical protein, conserved [Babesia bigemina]|uniref:C3H1-type domain-containing protein n=1 Tax=Babesia bigemina TaxID=5866 RepID=A0A061BL42_BABBI|nr:hypothetical protein, conserved [Babesia bigemina]CDR71600.1 hypothetical protein, conserved [Babesia bigemina]|eukprot:XP_012770547.1 hypothetical protein, conserved [Babesia bigemina]